MIRSVPELLAGPHHLDGLLLAEGEDHAADAGVLGAEDELAEVGGAAGHRDVVREGGLALVDALEQALERRRRRGDVDADQADLVTPASISACGSRKVTPVPDASSGYAFGSPQS